MILYNLDIRVIGMDDLKIGDIVARKSYGKDIFFKVVDIKENEEEVIATLKGISYRIEAEAPESDLEKQTEQNVRDYTRNSFMPAEKKARDIYASRHRRRPKKVYYRGTSNDNIRKFSKPGKILHIDGDESYMNTCIEEYKKLEMIAVGEHISEKDQPSAVYELLKLHKPDILVLTGHDGVIKGEGGYSNLNNYRNSQYYIEGVKQAREYNRDQDSLVIFAGACQSMYREILKAGANFASAPYRVLIHALDPVYVCQKIAFTNVSNILSPLDVVNATITGTKGIGGIETRGKYREGYPMEPYEN